MLRESCRYGRRKLSSAGKLPSSCRRGCPLRVASGISQASCIFQAQVAMIVMAVSEGFYSTQIIQLAGCNIRAMCVDQSNSL